MNIFIINYEFPPLGGGAGNASYHIAKHLAKSGETVRVLTMHFKGLNYEEETEGFTLLRVPARRKNIDRSNPLEMAAFMVSGLLHVPRILKTYKPDVSLAFFTLPSGSIAHFLKKKFNVPYVVSLRGGDVPGFFPEQLRRYHALTKPYIQRIWKDAAVVVANSGGLKALAKKTCPDMDIQMIPNGVDTEIFSCMDFNKQPSTDEIKIFTAGRLSKQKGMPYLIESIAALRAQHANVSLSIAGDGPSRPLLEKLVSEKNLRQNVHFLGWVTREKLAEHYRAADIFVFPSLDEGMPNVLLEAMSCGLPVVATAVSGNEELVENGKNGFLVPPRNAPALTDALARLLHGHALRESMGKESRKKAETMGWDNIAEQYLALIKNIVL